MTSVSRIAEVIAQLARFAHGEGRASGLTSAQWCALRYFARATRTSRTVTAFADYHHTTRGTASQTVQSLVCKHFLKRTRSQSDRRIIYMDLTDEGRDAWENDPFDVLVRAIATLPKAQQESLIAILPPLMEQIAEQQQVRCYGTCGTCRFLTTPVTMSNDKTIHFCRKHKTPIPHLDLHAICMNYKPRITPD